MRVLHQAFRFVGTLLVGVVCVGCFSKVDETVLLQSRGIPPTPTDPVTVNYYKVDLKVRSWDSVSRYRAGLYDVAAVDAVIDGRSESAIDPRAPRNTFNPLAPGDPITKARGAILQKLVEHTTGENVLTVAEVERYRALLRSIDDLASDLDSKKKFVVMYSSLAGVIANALAEYSLSQEVEQSTSQLIAQFAAPAIESALKERVVINADLTRQRVTAQALTAMIESVNKLNSSDKIDIAKMQHLLRQMSAQ